MHVQCLVYKHLHTHAYTPTCMVMSTLLSKCNAYTYLSIYLCIYLSVYQCMYESVYVYINACMYVSCYDCISV
jgi:hypothetical protein